MMPLTTRYRAKWTGAKTENIILALLLLSAGGLLLLGAQGIWFFGDDWEFIVGRRAMWARNEHIAFLFDPHNEHLSIIPILIYATLIKVFGIGSELPFLFVLIVSHLAVCLAIHTFIKRSDCGGRWGLWGVGWFVFFGAGAENLLWAFQIGFVLALALGLWQLLLVDHEGPTNRNDVFGACLGVLSVCTSGIGLTTVAMVGLLSIYRRRWIQLMLGSGLPFLIYATWFLTYGREKMPQVPHDISAVASYAVHGFSYGLDQVVQIPSLGIVVILAALIAVLSVSRTCNHSKDLQVLLIGGLILFYLLSGYGRSYLGIDQSTASRYVYIAGALSIPVIVSGFEVISRRWNILRTLAMFMIAFAIIANMSAYFLFRNQRVLLLEQVRPQIEVASLYSRLPITRAGLQPEPVYSPDINMDGLASLLDSGALALPTKLSDSVLLEGAIKFGIVIQVDQPSEVLLEDHVTLNTVIGGTIEWDEQGCLKAMPGNDLMTVAFTQEDAGFVTIKSTDASVSVAVQTTSGSRSYQVGVPTISDRPAYVGMWPQTGWPILLIDGIGTVAVCGVEPKSES